MYTVLQLIPKAQCLALAKDRYICQEVAYLREIKVGVAIVRWSSTGSNICKVE